MGLSTYRELADSVRDYALRSDLPMEVLVRMAEGKLSPLLDHSLMECTEYVQVAEKSRGLNIASLNLLELRDLRLATVSEDGEADEEGACQLRPASIAMQNTGYGTPTAYTRSGNTLILHPKPATGFGLFITYKRELPTLLDGTDSASNWLLRQFPQVYLHACLREAFIYLRDEKMVAQHDAHLQAALATVAQHEDRARNRGNTIIEGGQGWL